MDRMENGDDDGDEFGARRALSLGFEGRGRGSVSIRASRFWDFTNWGRESGSCGLVASSLVSTSAKLGRAAAGGGFGFAEGGELREVDEAVVVVVEILHDALELRGGDGGSEGA
ncbi:hypothetical protein RIF29_34586 [Crotalaria pallida]|uniref:Uncharacterized protein n=1 Tax=Crotalaria pallida TaxID=3830 RepID=A0AAN9EEU4_CROPI